MICSSHYVKFTKVKPESISACEVHPIYKTAAANFCLTISDPESVYAWGDLSCRK